MKVKTKNVKVMLLSFCALACVLLGNAVKVDTVEYTKAENTANVETKFSVSTDEESILFVTPINVTDEELAKIYEVGYTFEGEQPTTISAETTKYYTTLVTGGNTLTAVDLFGHSYTEDTPMIIWEVENNAEEVTATAYYKMGTVVDGFLYPDYGGVADEPVCGTPKSTLVYQEMKAVDNQLETFINEFPAEVTIANFRSLQTKIATMDEQVATLTEAQKAQLSNLASYEDEKNSFKLIDDISGTDIASRFTFSAGANGINNGDTAPNIATALNDATYGPCATIGKNTQGLTVSYANTDDLDLSEYTHVMFAIKNSLNTAITVATTSTGRTLAEGVAYGTFATITMTVEEFSSEGFAIYTNVQGSVWISAIIAVNKAVEIVTDDIATFIDEFPAEVTIANFRDLQTKIAAIDAQLETLTDVQKAKVSNLSEYTEKKNSFKLIDDISGTDIASRFTFSAGANGINNGDTAPNIAAALKDATYGPCATIGKNTQGLTVRYANADDHDLSGYTHVTFVIKNSLNTTITVKTTSTGRTLAEGVAYGTFTTITMTVEEFLSEGFAIYTNVQGSVWISSIIAVK